MTQNLRQRLALARFRRAKVVSFIRAAFESLRPYRVRISEEGCVRFECEVFCSRDL